MVKSFTQFFRLLIVGYGSSEYPLSTCKHKGDLVNVSEETVISTP